MQNKSFQHADSGLQFFLQPSNAIHHSRYTESCINFITAVIQQKTYNNKDYVIILWQLDSQKIILQ